MISTKIHICPTYTMTKIEICFDFKYWSNTFHKENFSQQVSQIVFFKFCASSTLTAWVSRLTVAPFCLAVTLQRFPGTQSQLTEKERKLVRSKRCICWKGRQAQTVPDLLLSYPCQCFWWHRHLLARTKSRPCVRTWRRLAGSPCHHYLGPPAHPWSQQQCTLEGASLSSYETCMMPLCDQHSVKWIRGWTWYHKVLF